MNTLKVPTLVLGAFGSGPASEIAPNLWQGGFPLEPGRLRQAGFNVLVLCAEELQPEPVDDHLERLGLIVIHAPMNDVEMDGEELKKTFNIASKAAHEVVEHLKAGRKVLVTCIAGRNRSGFVSALSLILHHGMSGKDAAERVRKMRANALTNESFSKLLERIPAPATTWKARFG